MRRVGLAGLWHETNTYSSRPTTLADFDALELLRGAEVVGRHAGTGSVIGGMLEAAGLEAVPVFHAGAWPAGRVAADALTALLDFLQAELDAARPLDGVLLNLHGAMVAETSEDVELEVLRVVRSAVGDVPVAAVLDLHGNPSPESVELCDAVIAYDTYPHVDMRERGREAARLMASMLAGTSLTTVVAKLPLLSCPLAQATDRAPMLDLLARARSLSLSHGVVRISLLPGFPYSDVARAGFSVLVVGEAGRHAAAAEAAAELAAEVEQRRDEFVVRRDDVATAVRRARSGERHPVVLVDVADNVGGGAPGDGTAILAELVAQQAAGAVVTIADAEVARAAAASGEGGRLAAEVGGKTDALHGAPVPIHGRVIRVTDGRYRTAGSWMTGHQFAMGTTAVVELDGILLVVTERPVPPFHAEQLASVGIDARTAAMVVAKGAVAWRAAYGDVAGDVIEVDTPGICPLDPTRLERRTAPMRFLARERLQRP